MHRTPSLREHCLGSLAESESDRMTFYSACQNGEYNLIEQMIMNGADVNGTYNDRPLIAAAGNGHKQCVQLLLQHGAQVNISNSRGQSALLVASRSLFMHVVEILLDAGATSSTDVCQHIHEALSVHGGIDQLPLICIQKLVNVLSLSQIPLVELSKLAFERARLDLAKYLLDKETDSIMKDRYSFALHYAVEYDWIDVVRHLLDRGVEINSVWNSETALCCACRHGHLNIVQLLLQRRADPYLHGSYGNNLLPIQIASMNGDGTLLKMLFEHNSSHRMSQSAVDLFCKNHPLHIAYDNGQWHIIELLLTLGFNVDLMDEDGLTVLHKAVKTVISSHANISSINPSNEAFLRMMTVNSHPLRALQRSNSLTNNSGTIAIIRRLISNGADCNVADKFGMTSLYRACAAGLQEIVKILLQSRYELHQTTTTSRPLLMAACATGNERVVDQLLMAGAPVNVVAAHAEAGLTYTTPLCVAAMYGHCEIVSLLLQYGAATDFRDVQGETAVHHVIKGAAKKQINTKIADKYTQTLELLLSHGASVNNNNHWGETALHKACSLGLDNAAKLLLERGANMYTTNWYDETPLMAACKNNHSGIVEHLLVHGVSEELLAKVKTSHGAVVTTPLHEAVRNGNEHLVNMLLSHGAIVNERNYRQETALHLATNCNMADCLLKRGAQINASTVDGETPLYVACQRGSVDLVDILLQYGAEPNGQSGTMPHFAHCQKDNASFSDMMLSNGADPNVMPKDLTVRATKRIDYRHTVDHQSDEMPLYGKRARMMSSETTKPRQTVDVDRSYSVISSQPSACRAMLQRIVCRRRLDCTSLRVCSVPSENETSLRLLSAEQVSSYQLPLCIATEKENARIVDLLIKNNAEVNLRDATGRAALHYACENNNSELVKLLLMAGANPNLPTETDVQLPFDKTFRLPLCIAAEKESAHVVDILIKNSADVNLRDATGRAALHYACENNNSELVKLLLMAGANPNLPTETDVQLPFDVTFRLPLCIAAEHGNRKIVDLLLHSQADICQQDGCGKTALHCAVKAAIRCRRNSLISLRYAEMSTDSSDVFTKLDAENYDDTDNCKNATTKHSDDVAWQDRNSSSFDDVGRHADVVVRLLDYGSDVNAVDVKGQTALYMAAKHGLVDFVKLILDGRRTDPNRSTSGRYPLNIACAAGNTTLTEMLLVAGADPNLMTPETDCTDELIAGLPLCNAVAKGEWQLMGTLLKHGADAKLTDWNGNSVLSYLFLSDDMDIDEDTLCAANLLLENGANPNQYNASNEGPVRSLLCRLAEPPFSELLRSFVQHGVRLDDCVQNIGECDRNSTFRLQDCVASSQFLRKTMFELFKAGAGRKFLAAGCESDRSMRGWGFINDYRLCQAVVLDGFRASDDDLKSLQDSYSDDDDNSDDDEDDSSFTLTFTQFHVWLAEDRKQAPSLMRQCRTAIRRQLSLRTGHCTILPLIDVLPLPNLLKSYLKYEGPISEVDFTTVV